MPDAHFSPFRDARRFCQPFSPFCQQSPASRLLSMLRILTARRMPHAASPSRAWSARATAASATAVFSYEPPYHSATRLQARRLDILGRHRLLSTSRSLHAFSHTRSRARDDGTSRRRCFRRHYWPRFFTYTLHFHIHTILTFSAHSVDISRLLAMPAPADKAPCSAADAAFHFF